MFEWKVNLQNFQNYLKLFWFYILKAIAILENKRFCLKKIKIEPAPSQLDRSPAARPPQPPSSFFFPHARRAAHYLFFSSFLFLIGPNSAQEGQQRTDSVVFLVRTREENDLYVTIHSYYSPTSISINWVSIAFQI